jgi:hypothetical protein
MAHGQIYLLHLQRSYRHARHYIGFTQNLEQRLAEHRAGRGSPLIAAAAADGIQFELAAVWPGDRNRERQLHNYKNTPRRLCPLCRAHPIDAAAGDGPDAILLAALAELAEPVTVSALNAHLRRCGQPLVASAHGRLEVLALAGQVVKCTALGEVAWAMVRS